MDHAVFPRNRDRHDDREPFLTSALSHFRFLAYLRKSLRKEPRMLLSLHAHVSSIGVGVRRPEAWGVPCRDGSR
jgi:hypothetical protein